MIVLWKQLLAMPSPLWAWRRATWTLKFKNDLQWLCLVLVVTGLNLSWQSLPIGFRHVCNLCTSNRRENSKHLILGWRQQNKMFVAIISIDFHISRLSIAIHWFAFKDNQKAWGTVPRLQCLTSWAKGSLQSTEWSQQSYVRMDLSSTKVKL